jgi:hypothetical protein
MTDDQSFTDLDALVLAEIESASGGRMPGRSEARPPKRHKTNNFSVKEERQAPRREVARIHGDDRIRHDLSGEEAEFLEQPLEMDSREPEELPPARLFTPEEEAFMHRAVGFLSGRENGDVILGQIWERLTESQPESFFEPQREIVDGSSMESNDEDMDGERHMGNLDRESGS